MCFSDIQRYLKRYPQISVEISVHIFPISDDIRILMKISIDRPRYLQRYRNTNPWISVDIFMEI